MKPLASQKTLKMILNFTEYEFLMEPNKLNHFCFILLNSAASLDQLAFFLIDSEIRQTMNLEDFKKLLKCVGVNSSDEELSRINERITEFDYSTSLKLLEELRYWEIQLFVFHPPGSEVV